MKALTCFGLADAFDSALGTGFLENLAHTSSFWKAAGNTGLISNLGHFCCNFMNTNDLLVDDMVIISTLPLRNAPQLQLARIWVCMSVSNGHRAGSSFSSGHFPHPGDAGAFPSCVPQVLISWPEPVLMFWQVPLWAQNKECQKKLHAVLSWYQQERSFSQCHSFFKCDGRSLL